MATLLKNTSMEGSFLLPNVYGGQSISPGGSVIIADTPANVGAELAAYVVGNQTSYSVSLCPDGQSGAIVPAVSPAIPRQVGKATVNATTSTVVAVPAALLQALTTYMVRARITGIGTPASTGGTAGKGLASELVGCFTTNSSGVPALTGSVTSVAVIKDAALNSADIPTLSVVSSAIAVQGVASSGEIIDFNAVVDVDVAST